MNPPQIDDYVSRKPLRYLGAAKSYSSRIRYYFSFPQFFMIAVLFYFESQLAQSIFPTVWTWALFLFAIGGLLMVVEYGIVHPAEITFNAHQEGRSARNPVYREVRENSEKLDRLLGARADGGDRCGCCGQTLPRGDD